MHFYIVICELFGMLIESELFDNAQPPYVGNCWQITTTDSYRYGAHGWERCVDEDTGVSAGLEHLVIGRLKQFGTFCGC